MSYNYNHPMFINNRVSSQSGLKFHTISNSPYTRFIPVKNCYPSYNAQTYSGNNRYSMYNYEFVPENVNNINRKNSFNESKTDKIENFIKETPKISSFSNSTNKKSVLNYKKRNESEYSSGDSASLISEIDNEENKKSQVPISLIEFDRNSVTLKKNESKNNSKMSSFSTESLIKNDTYSKEDYDNHHFVYNSNIYKQENCNFSEIANKINSVLDDQNKSGTKKFDSYTKFSYYNKLEEEKYSTDDSVEKLNTNLESLKHFFNKQSSLYYDSGIGADVSNSTYANQKINSEKIQIENKCLGFTEKSIKNLNNSGNRKSSYSETLNPKLVRNLMAFPVISSSSVSSDSSSSSYFSDSKKRNRLDTAFKSMNLKNSAKFDTNSHRISFRDSKKKIDLPIVNLKNSSRNIQEIKEDNLTKRESPIMINKADFTPNLLNRNNLLKNGKPIIKNIGIPPLPSINYSSNSPNYLSRDKQNILSPKIEINKNSNDSIKRNSNFDLNRIKQNSNTFGSNLSLAPQEDYRNRLLSSHQRTNSGSINIFEQNSLIENFKVISKKDQKCVAIKDFVGLFSENLSLKKGEKYTLLSKKNDNWCYLRDKNGNIGCAPGSCIDLISDEPEVSDSNKTSFLSKDWFHGNVTRGEAYSLLVGNQNFGGTFLVRNNSTEKGKFTLCVYKNGKVYNYKINFEDKKYFIDLKYKFNSLVELIEFYQKNQAGLISNLKYPAEKSVIDKKTLLDSLESVYNKFVIDRKDIEFHEKIGSGQFGIVLKAEFKKRKVVAVKKMKPGSKEDEMNFNREAEFMMKLQNLQTCQHRNLVQLFGLSKDFDDSILIITEFVRYGSLYNYLLKNKERICNSKNRFLRLVNICIDVCDGMEYLESRNIIHRDLATRNCLVGEGESIKVADFGLARFTDDCYIAHPQSQFPVKWSAPEVIKYRSYSTKSDVWSFSCLMYEVFTLGKMPYGGSTANSVAAKQIISGIIPERPIYCPNNLYDSVISVAWSKDPKDRPTFKELLKMLENFT